VAGRHRDRARAGLAHFRAHGAAVGDPEWYLAHTGKRPVQWLADLGVLGDHLSLVHMVHVDESEVALLAQSGTHVVHCPEASLRAAIRPPRAGCFPKWRQRASISRWAPMAGIATI
jgi:cytosine/adenosine deaminase-related metal-dependent hydrolase